MKLNLLTIALVSGGLSLSSIAFAAAPAKTELQIATVNNGHMLVMQKLTSEFERKNPDIKVKWVTMVESDLRNKLSSDVSAHKNSFDVVTVGMYEVPIWARKGWLIPFQPDNE